MVRVYAVNLVKPDSYISSREEGEERLKHLISAYRSHNRLPELSEDGSCYADALRASDPQSPRPMSKLAQALSWRRGYDDEYNFGTRAGSSLCDQAFCTAWNLSCCVALLVHAHTEVSAIKVVKGPNILYRLGLLVFRSTIMQLRDPLLIPARLIQALFLSLIVGLLYLQVPFVVPGLCAPASTDALITQINVCTRR
jgi:hypothetical protein